MWNHYAARGDVPIVEEKTARKVGATMANAMDEEKKKMENPKSNDVPKGDDIPKLNDLTKLDDVLPKVDNIPPKLDANMLKSMPAFFPDPAQSASNENPNIQSQCSKPQQSTSNHMQCQPENQSPDVMQPKCQSPVLIQLKYL